VSLTERQQALLRRLVEASRAIEPEHPERVQWEYRDGVARPVAVLDAEGRVARVLAVDSRQRGRVT
jgi:hypothetical protein